MKKYYSKYCSYILVIAIIGAVVLFAGIMLLLFFKNTFFDLMSVLLVLGGMTEIFSIPAYFAERSRWIALSDSQLILPRGTMVVSPNGKESTIFKRLSLHISDIVCVRKMFVKGDVILLTKDTYFYFFSVRNRNVYSLTLFSYGEDKVRRIMDELHRMGVRIEV